MYRGDFHVHSRRSHGGELTPEQLIAAARASGLDFIAVTEHNTIAGYDEWAPLSGDLLVIPGQEVVTETGHWLALGLRGNDVDQVLRAGGLRVVAHPCAPYPSGTFEHSYEGFDLVEVWNGPWTSDLPWQADNESALAGWARDLVTGVERGRWRPALGNSDAHLHGQIGTPHTVVLTDELSRDAVLAAVRAGHCWIAESAGVGLSFAAAAGGRTAQIGERLETGGEDVAVRAEVSGVPSGTVTFHTGRGVAYQAELSSEGSGTITWSLRDGRPGFVRVEVRHPGGGMAALTNPIALD
ncbi:CehA/McbA family metallohydrolase [Symbioplanes lichenis]|uniref:CehA/McbA family metallohydrolase n=1 Tax=Symbioplanes lichenis TaxID=1629072 RepID=UPI00273A32A8|nr:CehA/McbA family metallohydrolase [Actinoplanes lichenis]